MTILIAAIGRNIQKWVELITTFQSDVGYNLSDVLQATRSMHILQIAGSQDMDSLLGVTVENRYVPTLCYALPLPPSGTETNSFICARFSRILASALFLARGRWAVEYEGKTCLKILESVEQNVTSELSITCSTIRQGCPPLVSHLGLRKRPK
jgi:hypothetical protein